MPTKREIYLRRLETVRARLNSLSANGLYATPSSNLFYLTGIDFHRSERLTALLLFPDQEPAVICPAFEAARLRGMSAVERVVTWEETEDPLPRPRPSSRPRLELWRSSLPPPTTTSRGCFAPAADGGPCPPRRFSGRSA